MTWVAAGLLLFSSGVGESTVWTSECRGDFAGWGGEGTRNTGNGNGGGGGGTPNSGSDTRSANVALGLSNSRAEEGYWGNENVDADVSTAARCGAVAVTYERRLDSADGASQTGSGACCELA